MPSGTVKWWSAAKGFGFVTAEDGTEVFLHISAVESSGRSDLSAGQKITFNLVSHHSGRGAGGAIHPSGIPIVEPSSQPGFAAQFDDRLEAKNETFPLSVDLSNTRFLQGASFQGCIFERGVNGDADFAGHEARFEDCTFRGHSSFRPRNARLISLRSSTFVAGFELVPRDSGATIDLRFTRISGLASVRALDYGQPGYGRRFDVAQIDASDMTIEKEASLELAGLTTQQLSASGLILQDKASLYISDVDPGDFYLQDMRMTDKANVSLHLVNLAKARLSGTNVERFSFSNVDWPRSKHRCCLFEENGIPQANQSADLRELVAENYRQLVLNYEARRNYALAEMFHFGEMELARESAAATYPKYLQRLGRYLNAHWVYRALSCYGTSYKRALAILILWVVLFASLFMVTGFREPNGPIVKYDLTFCAGPQGCTAWKVIAVDFRKSLAMTLAISTLQKDRPSSPEGLAGSVLTSVLVVMSSAQAALLLFAVRRKFRRASI